MQVFSFPDVCIDYFWLTVCQHHPSNSGNYMCEFQAGCTALILLLFVTTSLCSFQQLQPLMQSVGASLLIHLSTTVVH